MATLEQASNLLQKIKKEFAPVVANVERLLSPITQFTRANPLISGLAIGTTSGIAAGVVSRSVSKKKRKKSSSKKRKSSRKTKGRKKSKRKSVKKSKSRKSRNPRKKIRYTKRGQPYIILSNGRARFIKQTSASRRKKLKGGYY